MTGYNREVAYRVFAKELRDTDIVLERDENVTYAPQYIMTPTGAKVNRVFVVGTLTEIEDVGQDTEYWRIRMEDPTGIFLAYAGQYQPDATRALVHANIPEILAMVAKIAVYMPEDGGTVISLRPETVVVVDAVARDRWIFQTAQQTLARIRSLESQNPEMVEDMKQYRQMVKDALVQEAT